MHVCTYASAIGRDIGDLDEDDMLLDWSRHVLAVLAQLPHPVHAFNKTTEAERFRPWMGLHVLAYNLLFLVVSGGRILQGNMFSIVCIHVSIVCRKVDFDAYMESWRAIATTDGSEGSLPITMRLSPVAFEGLA